MPSSSLEFYRFRYRDERTGKAMVIRYVLTDAEAQKGFGDRLIDRVEGTHEVREVGSLQSLTAAHLQSSPK